MRDTASYHINIPPGRNAAVLEIRREDAGEKPRPAMESTFTMRYHAGNAVTTAPAAGRSIAALGRTPTEALETNLRLRRLGKDWETSGMSAHDRTGPGRDRVSEAFQPKTELGKKLLALRRAYVEGGGKLLDGDALDRELKQRRDGIPHDEAHLPG